MERYRRYTTTLRLVQALARCRPTTHEDPATVSVLIACKTLAQRIEFLERQTDELTTEIHTLTTAINPALRAAYGVGPDTAAQLLITAGTNADRLRFKQRSPCSPVSPPSRPPPGKPPDTGYPGAGIVPRTTRCTASPWSAGPTIRTPATTSPANSLPAAPKKRFYVCSNAPPPAKCSNT